MKLRIINMFHEIRYLFINTDKKKLALLLIKNTTITIVLAYLFFDSLMFSLYLMPCFAVLLLYDTRNEKKRASDKLLQQFQDMLSIMSQNLQAGASVENAFINAEKELKKIHQTDSVFMRSLRRVVNGIRLNIPVEQLVNAMADTLCEEEIQTFATVFSGAKRSGGNLVDIIGFTVNTIMEKLRIKRETNMIISSKKMEQSIMSVIPMAVLLYVKLCCGDFINSLYHNPAGTVIMSIFIIIYMIAYIWSYSIMDIEV